MEDDDGFRWGTICGDSGDDEFPSLFQVGFAVYVCMRALAQDLVLDLEKTSFNRGGAPQPPQQTREPKDNSRSTAVSAS